MSALQDILKLSSSEVTAAMVKEIAADIGYDGDLEELLKGMSEETEHGSDSPGNGKYNVTGDDPKATAEIAAAHIEEIPDYYERLEEMEEEAKAEYGSEHGPTETEEAEKELDDSLSDTVDSSKMNEIKEFIKSNSSPSDEEMHSFLNSIGLDEHKGEEIIYQIAHDLSNKVAHKLAASIDALEEEGYSTSGWPKMVGAVGGAGAGAVMAPYIFDILDKKGVGDRATDLMGTLGGKIEKFKTGGELDELMKNIISKSDFPEGMKNEAFDAINRNSGRYSEAMGRIKGRDWARRIGEKIHNKGKLTNIGVLLAMLGGAGAGYGIGSLLD